MRLVSRKPEIVRRVAMVSGLLTALGCSGMALFACKPPLPPGKPVSQLNAVETDGYNVYQAHCARCHVAYDTQALHGPSLLGVFRQPYLNSGAPARDDRVTAVVMHGRGMMPALGDRIDAQQMQALLAYLHTL